MLDQQDTTRTCGFTTADGRSCPHPAVPGQIRCRNHSRDLWATGGPDGLTEIEVRTLQSQGITREQYEAYPRHLVASTIRDLLDAGIAPGQIAGWPTRFNFGSELVAMIQAGISPAQADPYPDRFSGNEIVRLHYAGISPAAAATWPSRFDGADIAYLTRKQLPPSYCNAYPEWMPPSVIFRLHNAGVTPEVIRDTPDLWDQPIAEDELAQFLSLL